MTPGRPRPLAQVSKPCPRGRWVPSPDKEVSNGPARCGNGLARECGDSEAAKDQRAAFTVTGKPAQARQESGYLGRACGQAMAEPEHGCRHEHTLQRAAACD